MLTHTLAGALIVWIVTLVVTEGFILESARARLHAIHPHLYYLSTCALCSGIWIGLAVGVIFPAPGPGRPLSGLLYSGGAHLILAVRNRLDQPSEDPCSSAS